MKTHFKTIILAALTLAVVGSIQAANVYSVNMVSGPQWPNVDGKWKAEFEASVGPLKYTFDLKGGPLTQNGVEITGKAIRASATETNETALTEGKLLVSRDISFVEALKIGDQDIRIEYKGKLSATNMNQLDLTRTVGDFGSNEIVAIREVPGKVTGKWEAEFDGAIGHLKYTFDLKADGGKLTGKATRNQDDQKTETVITNGVVTGDEVSFVEPLKVQDQEITITYKGKLAGDEIKFSRVVGEFATNDITAKRAM